MDDIRATLVLEDRVRDTRDHLRAAVAAGCCPAWLFDHLAAVVASLSAADPKAADLFVCWWRDIARWRERRWKCWSVWPTGPATRDHVSGLIDRLAEDVRSRAMAAMPNRGRPIRRPWNPPSAT